MTERKPWRGLSCRGSNGGHLLGSLAKFQVQHTVRMGFVVSRPVFLTGTNLAAKVRALCYLRYVCRHSWGSACKSRHSVPEQSGAHPQREY